MTVNHIYPFFTPDRDLLQRHLQEAGIQTISHYPLPLHRQACFAGMFTGQEFPEAERIAREELSLPISPIMTADDASYVKSVIQSYQAGDKTLPAEKRNVPFLDLTAINAQYEPELSEAALRVVQSGWYVNGEECHAFEREFANYCADKSGLMELYCVGCANGLDALTLILLALKQKNGWTADCEVIVPAMTFVATGQAVVRAGLTLRLCDVTADGLMDPMSAATAVTDRTVALLPVHLYGQRADLTTLAELADVHDLVIIQDAAQAHGQPLDLPNHAITAAFSFYPGKNLGALGDGGAVITDDETLAEHIRSLANYGSATKYHHDLPEAMNSRLDELQAALLRVKLRHLDRDNKLRQTIADIYDS